MVKFFTITLVPALLSLPAMALEINQGDTNFFDNETVTSTVLKATSASNTYELSLGSNASLGGNMLELHVFTDMFGVTIVNQNTAPSATIQQGVTIDVDFNEAPAP